MNEQNTLSALATRYGVGETLTGTILIVDDDQENLAVLQAFLDSEYVVHAATSGRQALEIAVTTGIDVVIADHRMPEMTGTSQYELVARPTMPPRAPQSLRLTGETSTMKCFEPLRFLSR